MAPRNMWSMEYCAHRPVSCKEGFHLDPLPKLIKLLRQIREVKLMEEDEALEMGREAATIRQSLGFIFARLFFPLVTVQCTSGQGSLCQDPWGGAKVQPEDQQGLQNNRRGSDQDERPSSIVKFGCNIMYLISLQSLTMVWFLLLKQVKKCHTFTTISA